MSHHPDAYHFIASSAKRMRLPFRSEESKSPYHTIFRICIQRSWQFWVNALKLPRLIYTFKYRTRQQTCSYKLALLLQQLFTPRDKNAASMMSEDNFTCGNISFVRFLPGRSHIGHLLSKYRNCKQKLDWETTLYTNPSVLSWRFIYLICMTTR